MERRGQDSRKFTTSGEPLFLCEITVRISEIHPFIVMCL